MTPVQVEDNPRCARRSTIDQSRCTKVHNHVGRCIFPADDPSMGEPEPAEIPVAEIAAPFVTPLERTQALVTWWRNQAENEINQTVAKAVEYSGTSGGLPMDLVDLGRQIAFVQRREHEFTDAQLAEIGVWSYIQGKLNRWSSALRNGRMVSDDTLLDIGVYVRIAQHIRASGEWP